MKAAFRLCKKFGKSLPYRGYACDFGNGLVLTHTPRNEYILLDFPITPEKVAKFERENAELIASIPQPDPSKLLEIIRSTTQPQ